MLRMGRKGEAMGPDCRPGHVSRWDRDDKGRVRSFRNRGSRPFTKYTAPSSHVLSFRVLKSDSLYGRGPLTGREESGSPQSVQATVASSTHCSHSTHTLPSPLASLGDFKIPGGLMSTSGKNFKYKYPVLVQMPRNRSPYPTSNMV